MQEIEVNPQSINVEVTQTVINVEAYQTAPTEIDVQSRGYQSPVTKFIQYAYQITEQDADAKKVILNLPAAEGGLIRFQPRGAPCVIITLDYIFNSNDNSISWSGLGLDGLIEKDDWVEISYSYFYH